MPVTVANSVFCAPLLLPGPALNVTQNLAIFDLDHTLLAGDSDHLWGEFLIEQGLVDAAGYRQANDRFYVEYQAGTLDIQDFAAFAFAPLVKYGRAQLAPLRSQFVEQVIAPLVAASAPALLERHRSAGDLLLITTATNHFVTEPIAELLGVEHLIATDPEETAEGFTGRIAGQPNFQGGKIKRLLAWLEAQQISPGHSSCYSDSINDLPLLEWADQPCAVDPDPRLRATALQRGWPVISLRQAPAAELAVASRP